MSCYIIELADCALTPYAIETESGTEYGWGLMPKRKVDLDELLRVADECDAADVDGVTDWAARIRKAVGRMSAKTTELKPCPFCGSGNVRYKEAEHAVVCARCKARGSIAPDEETAIRMWDERAGELKPDSWEKLEEDVNLGCRDYCEKHRLEECDYNMRVHMLDRAKKLAGIEEAER